MEITTRYNMRRWLYSKKNILFERIFYPELRVSYRGIADCFLFSLFIMPSYFGIRLAFFDLTAVRFFEILLLYLIWRKESRRSEFCKLVMNCPHTLSIGLYLFIIVYTNLIHFSLGTIFYWTMNGVCVFYLITFLIFTEWGLEGILNKIQLYTLILTILSPLEYVLGRSPFAFLDTLGKIRGATVRFGNVRIMGNCTTANGYAMFLCILFPLCCINVAKNKVDMMKHKWILLLIVLNIFLTGARLSVGIIGVELVLCYLLQTKEALKKTTLLLILVVPLIIALAFIFQNVGFVRSLLCTFFSAFDEVFETQFAVNYGADPNLLAGSTRYREVLFQNTILSDWLNPFLGRGGKYQFSMYIEGYYIQSCDNFYVVQYIYYAWPGLCAWLLMSFHFIIRELKLWIISGKKYSGILSVSMICYFISLWYLDHLQTFPIMFAVFAMEYSYSILERRRV